jgi:hypothetical protein
MALLFAKMTTGSVTFSSSSSSSLTLDSLSSVEFCLSTLLKAFAKASGLKVFFCFLALEVDSSTSSSDPPEASDTTSSNTSVSNSSKKLKLKLIYFIVPLLSSDPEGLENSSCSTRILAIIVTRV